MRCPVCDADAPDSSRFCPACGASIDGGTDVTRLSNHNDTRRTPSSASTIRSGTNSGWLSSSGSIDHGRFTPGTVLADRYRVINLLGAGGMGEVYRADDLRLGQAVALKFLPASLASDAQRLAQFHNEVRVARQVSHPNVCRVYDIGEIDGQLFLTMEYVDGEDLSASLRRVGRFPEERAIEIARQICAGLGAAHERGVLHRDIKPANIMLDSAGRARLMDFGLAAVGAVEDIRAGTPAYMAPEQIEGREVTVKSDIYALGLVLYELFTGRRAFQARTLAELIEQQASGRITPPTEIVTTLDPVIERCILRCVDRDPALRPTSALALAAALPGGDPLAAALAAGETPSPEMVAAAGATDKATLSPLIGYGGIALVALLLLVSAYANDRTNLFARVPLDKPPAVLADRAETVRRNFGYVDKPADTAYGFNSSTTYLNWARAHQRAAAQHWPQLNAGRPAVIHFWYRASPHVLIPLSPLRPVTSEDPPIADVTGEAIVWVDTEGRLLEFTATPPEHEPADPPKPVAWDRLFEAAGLDASRFVDARPERVPPQFADERRAWTGTFAEAPEVPIRVEAAAYRGRLVSVSFSGPWTGEGRDAPATESQSAADRVIEGIFLGLVFAILAGAAIQARRNVVAGRGDRTGAMRTATFTLIISIATWCVSPNTVSDFSAAAGMSFFFLAVAFLISALTFIMYLAMEPALRRYWPHVLVTWTRLVSGRVRDPLVGRDLFVGTLLAVVMSVALTAATLLPALLGRPEPMPAIGNETMLMGIRIAFQNFLNTMLNGIVLCLPMAILTVVLRRLLRWPWLSTLVMGIILMAFNSANVGLPWLNLVLRIAASFGVLFILLRFGLFATVVAIAAGRLMRVAPLTLDGTRLYAPQATMVAVLVLAIMGLGYWMARGSTSPRRRQQ